MKEPAASLIAFCVSMLTLAALGIFHTNHRLDALSVRGAPTLQTESIILLAVFGVLVVLGGRAWSGIWAYILSPVAAFGIVVAYFSGTARFD